MRVKTRCPNCEQLLMVREEELGKRGRCPTCKQIVMLASAKRAATPAAAAARPGTAAAPAASPAKDQAIPLALAPAEEGMPSIAPIQQDDPSAATPLAVEALEEDVARLQLSFRGAIPTPVTGQVPLGKQRHPGLVFLAVLVFPFYAIYWYIVIRAEVFAHRRLPARTTGQIAFRAALVLVTAGVFGWIYCCYLVPKRIAEMQSACGDPYRVSAPSCLILGLIPCVGWALDVLIMQKALTRHWQWHTQRGDDSVTIGLAT